MQGHRITMWLCGDSSLNGSEARAQAVFPRSRSLRGTVITIINNNKNANSSRKESSLSHVKIAF